MCLRACHCRVVVELNARSLPRTAPPASVPPELRATLRSLVCPFSVITTRTVLTMRPATDSTVCADQSVRTTLVLTPRSAQPGTINLPAAVLPALKATLTLNVTVSTKSRAFLSQILNRPIPNIFFKKCLGYYISQFVFWVNKQMTQHFLLSSPGPPHTHHSAVWIRRGLSQQASLYQQCMCRPMSRVTHVLTWSAVSSTGHIAAAHRLLSVPAWHSGWHRRPLQAHW